ncbi:hypothetical protein IODZLFCR_CDS0006 [Salmonella phage vB_SalP_SE29]|uniref:Uncharacterized protein n=1 Tax=Salmonella phage vB_SalP_SE29 TaxID=3134913 RepID=A0AAX4LYR4_9CAUD
MQGGFWCSLLHRPTHYYSLAVYRPRPNCIL